MNDFAISENTKVRTLALKVNDLDKMFDFYNQVLGLVSLREENDMIFLGTPNDKEELIILELDSDINNTRDDKSNLFHFAFLLPTHEDLSALYCHVENLGLSFEKANDYGTCEALYIADPEGNLVEICVNYSLDKVTQAPIGRGVERGKPIDLANFRQQSAIQYKFSPSGTTVGHVHFNVSNLDTLIDYYSDVLGFTSAECSCSDTKLISSLTSLNFIAADEHKNIYSSEGQTTKVDFVVFEMNEESDLENLRTHLNELGEKFFYNKGKKIIQVFDPYGVRLWFVVRNNSKKCL